jgi:hypothetical protein
MNIKDLFKRKVAEVKAKGYTPKFKVGDIILNKKYIIVRKVVDIIGMEKVLEYTSNAQYVLRDIHNPLKERTAVEQFKVYKQCVKIDDYYDKIDERAAKVLYGFKD